MPSRFELQGQGKKLHIIKQVYILEIVLAKHSPNKKNNSYPVQSSDKKRCYDSKVSTDVHFLAVWQKG